MAIDQNLINLLMEKDPFVKAGYTDLSNVRPFEDDPRLKYRSPPLQQYGVNPAAVAQEKASSFGYTYPGEQYIRDLPDWRHYTEKSGVSPSIQSKINKDVETTITHEGIHGALNKNQNLVDLVGADAGSAFGPIGKYSSLDDWYNDAMDRIWQGDPFEDVLADLPSTAVKGADYARNEMITRYLENQIYGDEDAPFEEWMGGVDPYGTGRFNYITMDRPGQGPLGIDATKKILAKRLNPYLRGIKRQAEGIRGGGGDFMPIPPPREAYVTPPRGGGADVMPIPPPRNYVTPPRGGGADVMPVPPVQRGGDAGVAEAIAAQDRAEKKAAIQEAVSRQIGTSRGDGGGQRGSAPTGTAGRNPWGRADGGLIDFYRYGGFVG